MRLVCGARPLAEARVDFGGCLDLTSSSHMLICVFVAHPNAAWRLASKSGSRGVLVVDAPVSTITAIELFAGLT
jgi:hypothetical protein